MGVFPKPVDFACTRGLVCALCVGCLHLTYEGLEALLSGLWFALRVIPTYVLQVKWAPDGNAACLVPI